MASDQPRYVAEGFHRRPAVEELERVLDRYDRARRAASTGDEDADVLEARLQFRLDWAAAREDRLRAALEEVAWILERRGHHAWIEPATVPTEVADVVESAGQRTGAAADAGHPLSELVLSFLPGGSDLLPEQAAGVALVPDPERCRADVVGWFPGERASPIPLARGLALEDLVEAQVVGIVTQQVAQVLLDAVPPLPEPAIPERESDRQPDVEPQEPAVPPEQRQWADTALGAHRRVPRRR